MGVGGGGEDLRALPSLNLGRAERDPCFLLDPIARHSHFQRKSSLQLEPQHPLEMCHPLSVEKGGALRGTSQQKGLVTGPNPSSHVLLHAKSVALRTVTAHSQLILPCKAQNPRWDTYIATYRDVLCLSPSFALFCIAWQFKNLKVQVVSLIQNEPVLTSFRLHTRSLKSLGVKSVHALERFHTQAASPSPAAESCHSSGGQTNSIFIN